MTYVYDCGHTYITKDGNPNPWKETSGKCACCKAWERQINFTAFLCSMKYGEQTQYWKVSAGVNGWHPLRFDWLGKNRAGDGKPLVRITWIGSHDHFAPTLTIQDAFNKAEVGYRLDDGKHEDELAKALLLESS